MDSSIAEVPRAGRPARTRRGPGRRWGRGGGIVLALAALLVLAPLSIACGVPGPEGGGEGAGDAGVADVDHLTLDGMRSALASFVAAWEREDPDAIVEMLGLDPVVVDPTEKGRYLGREEIRRWVEEAFAAQEEIRIEIDGEEMRAYGSERTGWISAPYTYTFRDPEGDEPVQEGWLSTVWFLNDGGYRLVLFHASRKVDLAAPEDG